LLLQIFLDSTRLSSATRWIARTAAPLGAIVLSGGLFGMAYSMSFRWALYLGAIAMLIALVITGVGLVRDLRASASHRAI
jgi:hypothetical protein